MEPQTLPNRAQMAPRGGQDGQKMEKKHPEKEVEKELYVPVKGHLEGTLACFEIIAKLMNFPFKKESVKNFLKEYLTNHKFLSLQVCGEIASYHGLQINISNIDTDLSFNLLNYKYWGIFRIFG